ncbi:EF-hand domain-containing protein [Denitrobaculum tricleocarpae]|uniref:EF-hand domain-containing protein n=1 Tax=Denitrobaculum tricleocarpae TaxID=2591009 RepID=A0A545U2X1_9PROT|nr:hypothetical protein [Denitrobaculum tricleocarpae]TQV83820.1 hypothetical protein FKG95_04370 [Denitrobaculum tricleocarpae]
MRKCLFGILTAVALIPANPTLAEDDFRPMVSGEDWLWQRIFARTKQEPVRSAILKHMDAVYRKYEQDGVDGISQEDYDLGLQLARVKYRNDFLNRHWLPYDLDGDQIVTHQEVEAVSRNRVLKNFSVEGVRILPTSEQLAELEREAVADTLKNLGEIGDGIDFSEAVMLAARMEEKTGVHRGVLGAIRSFMSLDRDDDLRVSRAEFDAAVLEAFARIDSNGDGLVDADEFAVAERERRAFKASYDKELKARRAARGVQYTLRNCKLPKVSPEHIFALVSARYSNAVANIVLGDHEDAALVEQIVVEPGQAKLVLALTGSASTIWRISGAVDRVEHIIVGSGVRQQTETNALDFEAVVTSGVTGVEANKVTFAQSPSCLPFLSKPEDRERKKVDATLKRLTGSALDHVSVVMQKNTVFVPSLTTERNAPLDDRLMLPSTGPGETLRQRFMSRYRSGIIDIDPARVVANGKARSLDVLPSYAGLAQLLDQGALEAVSYSLSYWVGERRYTIEEGGAEAVPDDVPADKVSRFPSKFLIKQKIEMPASLCDDMVPRFSLARGVPLPTFLGCHPRIMIEETGETLICKNVFRLQCRP